ncbi:heme-degrading domain-containing protein [Aquibacillus halophilus]|uniref:Heme-degrading domain-containing protein n=1 Tax=Aquibacillus halophilus TaxID=930132 RepID=A0A6A8DFQ1_9BACI|nr:heme-degrading domain-containing protein [Aquibacillus halophilus]MRH44443.1 heme-degrading domain-containing protein [Aquibacillus halophilus]
MENYNAILDDLLKEETDFQFSEFTNITAYQIGSRIIEKALKENKSIVVNIQRDGEPLFYTKMNGTTTNNDEWVTRKNNVLSHFKHSSYYMHVYLKSINSNVESHSLDPKDYAAEGGAFPLIIKDTGIIGTITVSGLTGEEDHRMITSVLSEYLNVN